MDVIIQFSHKINVISVERIVGCIFRKLRLSNENYKPITLSKLFESRIPLQCNKYIYVFKSASVILLDLVAMPLRFVQVDDETGIIQLYPPLFSKFL